MSLASNLQDAFTRVATEFKTLRTMIGGNGTADITGLTTTSKVSLVAAINEVNAKPSGGGPIGGLSDVTITTAANGHILRYNSTSGVWENVLGTSLYDAAGSAAAAQSAAIAASQPLDADLSAIASLTTTTYGRAFLSLADQAALMGLVPGATEAVQGKIEIATQAETNTGTDDVRAVTPLKLQSRLAAFAQPLDSDLTAIAALTTTTYGRAFLALADQAALMGLIPAASETVQGKVELATAAETATGTDSTRAVHPAGLKPLLDAKASTSSLAAVATSGNAADLTGTLNTAQLPALAVISVQVVANQTARLALNNVQAGDVAKQSDTATTWMLAAEPASVAGNWVELEANGDVLSVAGRTGTVVLTKTDVGLSNVDNTSDAAKPVSTATQTALNGKANTAHTHLIADIPVAASGTSSSTQVVRADDSRLSDSRTPTTHSHTLTDLPVAPSGTSNSTQLVRADDSRLSNSRTPTAHTHTLADLPDAWVKRSVRAATTVNITLSGLQTVDGVALAANDRVLVKNQTTASQNGIYTASATAWARTTDTDSSAELAGSTASVDEGGQAGQMFTNTFPSTGVVGTTAVTFYKVLTDQVSYSTTSHNHNGTYEPVISSGTTSQYYRGDKSWQTLDKATVGLGNVDNTSDVSKPVSTATQTALNAKQNLDATLTALAGLATTANQMIYSTGVDAFAMATLTPTARGLLDDNTTADMRTTLDVYSKGEVGDPNTDFVATFVSALA